MNEKPFTITFYSYRGGADRLTALVNVGVDLARRGRKVLLVDFDLESPGLTELAPLRLEQPHLGLVEFVAEYLDTNQAPPVSEYLYRAASIGKKGGELWVMPAGKEDPDYWAALARIDWQELYDSRRWLPIHRGHAPAVATGSQARLCAHQRPWRDQQPERDLHPPAPGSGDAAGRRGRDGSGGVATRLRGISYGIESVGGGNPHRTRPDRPAGFAGLPRPPSGTRTTHRRVP